MPTELGGGLLLSGYGARTVSPAIALLVWSLRFSITTIFQNQMSHFLKNLMMASGLQITYFGAGAFSLHAGSGRRAQGVPPLRKQAGGIAISIELSRSAEEYYA